MAKKITRTITIAEVTYEYVNVDDSTIHESMDTLTDNVTSPQLMLRYLKRKHNTQSTQVIKITDVHYLTRKYEMPEEEFIAQAKFVKEVEK